MTPSLGVIISTLCLILQELSSYIVALLQAATIHTQVGCQLCVHGKWG